MWDTIAPENRNGILRHYLVSVLEVETNEMSTYTAVSTQVNISSLHPYYTYTCNVAAVTNRVGPFSQFISIITPQEGCVDYQVSGTHRIYIDLKMPLIDILYTPVPRLMCSSA